MLFEQIFKEEGFYMVLGEDNGIIYEVIQTKDTRILYGMKWENGLVNLGTKHPAMVYEDLFHENFDEVDINSLSFKDTFKE